MELHVKKIQLKFLGLLFLCFIGSVKTEAHPMPNSIIKLFVLENSIKCEAYIPVLELENALGGSKDSLLNNSFLNQYFLKHLQLKSAQGSWIIKIDSLNLINSKNEVVGNYKELKVDFLLIPLNKANLREFTFYYDVVLHQVITHSILVVLVNDWQNGLTEEMDNKEIGTISYDVVKGKILPLEVKLDNGSRWKGFTSMVNMGMLHIKNGTDHLLFLLSLLLPAFLIVKNKKWAEYSGLKKGGYKIFKIVTAFTIGHSITLLVGAFSLIKLPIQLIEIAIALSILVSAVHCIYPIFYKKEIFVAAGFGFIHGLAFSQTLQVLHLERLNLAISVLGFNLGIEVMQLLIICLIIPWFILLSKTSFANLIKNLLALFLSMAAIGWIIQRITNKPNFLSNTIDSIFSSPLWLVIGFGFLSLTLFLIDKKLKTSIQRN